MRRKRYTQPSMYGARPTLACHTDRFTWLEFIDKAEHGTSTIKNRQSHNNTNARWQGATWEDSVRLARSGWADGVGRAKGIVDRLESKVGHLIPQQTLMHDITGEILDVGRYCSGEPEHWGNWEVDYTRKLQSTGTKHLRIMIHIGASACVSPEALIVRGAAIASYVCLLERAGIRTDVTIVSGNGPTSSHGGHAGSKPIQELYVKVKEYGQYLDLDRLIYAVAHPSVLRVHEFSIMEQLPQAYLEAFNVHEGGGSYGYSVPDVADKGDVYIPCRVGPQDEEEIEAWVVKMLREQGAINQD